MSAFREYINKALFAPVSIAPLVTFRILFGAVMFISIARFAWKGWIADFYIEPAYYFTYYGFDWIEPLTGVGMYVVFALMALATILIMIGLWYRMAATAFFVLFTYVELLDKTYYLNHYYFISIVSFLMIWLPAGKSFSVDAFRQKGWKFDVVPAWTINVIKLQLGMVYFFAGLAKINSDWLLQALPLKIWLPARSHWPVIGSFFNELWVAYAFSWAGMLYDLLIPFLLLNRKTRLPAYIAVVVFHVLTRMLFPIGMFPFIMIALTLVFFSPAFHERFLAFLAGSRDMIQRNISTTGIPAFTIKKWQIGILTVFFVIQLILPFRYLMYPGSLFWTEQGYRFSWRVMLMEKVGLCTFYIKSPDLDRPEVVDNSLFLTRQQEHMMATQPDMILQFAHHLAEVYKKRNIESPEVYADCIVSLQGQRSRPFVNSEVNLAGEKRGWKNKNWILPFEND